MRQGAFRWLSRQLAIAEGRYTGEIDYYAYAEEKARAIEELAAERGYDLAECWAYSDSITDQHMLEIVGHPHAVNPDKELRRVARTNGWPVLVFSRPVGLRSRRLPPARPTLAALAVGGAMTAAGVLWSQARRRRP